MVYFQSLLSLLSVVSIVNICLGQQSISSIEDLPFDEDARLTSHFLLYAGDEDCLNQFEGANLELRQAYHMGSADLVSRFLPQHPEFSCAAICLERGTSLSHIYDVLEYQRIVDENDMVGSVEKNCQAAELGFMSYLSGDATVYWVNGKGERSMIGPLVPGERNTFWIQSFLGHRFLVVEDSTQQVADNFTVEFNMIRPIGQYTSHVMTRDVHETVRQTFEHEWVRSRRVQRTYTEYGFNKGKLPKDLYSSMSSYYYNNRKFATIEEWKNKGVFVNWWEKDVLFISMPFRLKKYWQSRLKTMVEKWVGIPLELTDIYGMRRYEDGARLLTHVDREATHACSLIINVDQGGIREPWKIEIYDFADRLHEIEMEPGDIVYYESARCLHGRMQPLQGAYYVNLFAHYRPVGDPEWFLKPNPPDNTPQMLDIGTCQTDGTKVECDNADVPWLSPKLQTLKSGKDLYDFWVSSGEVPRNIEKAPIIREEL